MSRTGEPEHVPRRLTPAAGSMARRRRPRPPEGAALAVLAACVLAAPAAAQDVGTSSPSTPSVAPGAVSSDAPYPGAASSGIAPPSFGTSTLPSLGSGVRVGDLRSQLSGLLPRAALPRALGPAVQFFPSIGVDVGFTDNATQSPGGKADAFTLITPSLLVTADTRRVQANLSYAPTAQLYASTRGASRFDQYLNAGALVSVVPDTLFVDLRGSVFQQSLFGGFSQGTATPSGASTLNRQDQVTTASFLVAPYLVRRFGGYGTGQLAYSLSYVDQGSLDQSNVVGTTVIDPVTGLPTTIRSRGVGNLLTQRESATFTSGENLGRIQSTLSLAATQYDGSGVYENAYRNEAAFSSAYALTRTIAVLGTIGYQDLRYATTPPTRVNGLLWNVGVRYAPAPENFVTVSYGRRDGFNALAADASYQTTPRTRVFLRYSTGLTTDLEETQNLLASTQVDSFGNSVDAGTGRPVLRTTNNFFGVQDNLYRLRRFSVSGVLLLDRDTVTLSFVHETRSLVGRVPTANVPAGGTAGGGFYTVVQWQHDLSPAMQSQVTLQYGTRDDNGAGAFFQNTNTNTRVGSSRVVSATASLSYQLSQTVSTRALYQISNQSGNGTNGDLVQNLVLVGLRKTF